MSEQDLDFVDGEAAPAPSSGERVPCRMRRSVGNAGARQAEAASSRAPSCGPRELQAVNARICRCCGAPKWSPHSPSCRDQRPSLEQRQLWGTKSRAARGYGEAHKAMRKRYTALVASGLAVCARCGKPVAPRAPLDLGHTPDRTGWTGPEHPKCNRVAGVEKRRSRHEPVSPAQATVSGVVTAEGTSARLTPAVAFLEALSRTDRR
jgi:hypothetical protein